MIELEFDYTKEYVKYIINHNLWDKENEKLKKNVYPVLGIRNEKYDEKGNMYNAEQYVKGFTTKPPKQETCQYCFTELTGRHRKFCSIRCGDLFKKIKNKREELGVELIFWNENKDREIPNQKDMKGISIDGNGEYIEIKNVITKKSGKPLVKDSKESQDFSKGKDY